MVREDSERWFERWGQPVKHLLAGYTLCGQAVSTHVCPGPRHTWCPRAGEDRRAAVAYRIAVSVATQTALVRIQDAMFIGFFLCIELLSPLYSRAWCADTRGVAPL